ncbi:matrixin family metalloprotease [Streptococcus salivarius]|uniref:matrixin family metalloprotease n=1 Tax=Streptococcus salivarius TaxID=1304 RepID=UPI00319E93E2
MLHSFKTQGTKTMTLLTLATVGIISAFLVGSPQHASADQTYVSDPNQTLTFSELETGTTTNTIAQTGVSTETPTTVTTISHTSVDDLHTHENDYEQAPTNTPTFEELKQNSQTASSTVDSQTGSKTYETRIPTNTDSNHKAVENQSKPKTETVAQAQTWSKDGATWISTEINNGNVHKILSTYIPKPLTPSTKPTTTATPKSKQSTPAVSQPKKPATVANKPTAPTVQPKKPTTVANKPATSTTTQPKKPTTTVTKPTTPKATPIQPAKPVDRIAQVWQKNNELVKENYDTPHWSSKEATVFINAKNPEIVNAYKQAITSWNNTGAFNFLLTNDKQKANIIADEGNVAAPLGVTYSTYYLPTKQYSNATVYLNTFHVQNNYYQKNGGKLLNTAQHELGHSIGLEHNSAVASVMEPKGGKTSIQPVDINNVKKLYSKI